MSVASPAALVQASIGSFFRAAPAPSDGAARAPVMPLVMQAQSHHAGHARARASGHAFVDDAAEDEDGDDMESSQDEVQTSQDALFLNDEVLSQSSYADGFRGPGDQAFRRRGRGAEPSAGPTDEPAPKKMRIATRGLDAMYPLGLYFQYGKKVQPGLDPRVSHLVSPYRWYHHNALPDSATAHTLAKEGNEFVSAEDAAWLNDETIQREFAHKFASYGHSTAPKEELRQIARMQKATGDRMHCCSVPAVAEVICAHDVLDERDELDRQPAADVSHEFVCKGDFLTEMRLRSRCPSGGMPGLASVALFAFEECPGHVHVSDLVLAVFRYWNLGLSRPDLVPAQHFAIESDTVEVYKSQRAGTKARAQVTPLTRDEAADTKAILAHVDAELIGKHAAKTVHTSRQLSNEADKDVVRNSLFECQLHVVPQTVRDSDGKPRIVVASVLVIRGTVPGCDPLLALAAMAAALQGFDKELLLLAQHMVRLIGVDAHVSVDQLFKTGQNDTNIAKIAHEANLPLAFFNFLRQSHVSVAAPSAFAADWMGQRIDVYDAAEVALYCRYLDIVRRSRVHYHSAAALHTMHDSKDARNSRLPLSKNTVNWSLFFPGALFSLFSSCMPSRRR